jgi:hypothetical protein
VMQQQPSSSESRAKACESRRVTQPVQGRYSSGSSSSSK